VAADVSGLKSKAMLRYGRLAIEGARAMQTELRVAAPHKTYQLRNSIVVRSLHTGPALFTITAETGDLVQANTTNDGARPHIIRPRRAQVLSFYWPKVGARVVRRFVNHPGNVGSHWWDRVVDRHPTILARVLRRL
jgi:hypothetical protein